MQFEILGEILQIETFAAGSGIREIARLRGLYGCGRWRKRKGTRVRLPDVSLRLVELCIITRKSDGFLCSHPTFSAKWRFERFVENIGMRHEEKRRCSRQRTGL